MLSRLPKSSRLFEVSNNFRRVQPLRRGHRISVTVSMPPQQPSPATPTLAMRSLGILEILVKIGAGGAGWQYGDNERYDAGCEKHYGHTLLWAATFDALGVGVGHAGFKVGVYGVARLGNYLFSANFNLPRLQEEAAKGLHLGSASFCSGFIWRPAVEAATYLGFGYIGTTLFTGVVCTGAFAVGMQGFRGLYSAIGVPHIDAPSAKNVGPDLSVSLSVGSAGAVFVSADATYPNNPLKEILGITDPHAHAENMKRAGMSTASGFLLMQALQGSVSGIWRRYQDIQKQDSASPTPTSRRP